MTRRSWLTLLTALPLLSGCRGKPPANPGPDSNEVRQFHQAIKDGDVEIIRRLVAAKPYLVNARDEQGVTPLQAAKREGNEDLAELIRQKGGQE